jgi:hypothetical protein
MRCFIDIEKRWAAGGGEGRKFTKETPRAHSYAESTSRMPEFAGKSTVIGGGPSRAGSFRAWILLPSKTK